MDEMDKHDYDIRKRYSVKWFDRFLHNLHTSRKGVKKFLTVSISLAVYAAVILVFGNFLKVSSNYFILFPLVAVSFSFGLPGGVIGGIFSLPLNLLIFILIGHPEYSPESKIIAEITGIIIGTIMGYLSDYFFFIEIEVERRRIAEEMLQKSVKEKEILIQEIHHRVKNNLNLVKSLIQLQVSRSENQIFINESKKLISRIFSISRVHEQLYRGDKMIEPAINEYLPPLIEDILAGLDHHDIALNFDMNIPEIRLSIEQATSLGLILNEVLTNAIKYSFPLVESPTLDVMMKTKADKTIIELSNNAPTFIPEAEDGRGLGLKLIKTLCEQIEADYEWIPGNGTTFRLTLPV